MKKLFLILFLFLFSCNITYDKDVREINKNIKFNINDVYLVSADFFTTNKTYEITILDTSENFIKIKLKTDTTSTWVLKNTILSKIYFIKKLK